jgi:hypothetical protein
MPGWGSGFLCRGAPYGGSADCAVIMVDMFVRREATGASGSETGIGSPDVGGDGCGRAKVKGRA